MLQVFDESRLASAGPRTLSDLLEQGNIVYFPVCPVPLPPEEDLEALRNELPRQLTRKNVSYHPEADSVRGIPGDSAIYPTAYRTLTAVRQNIADFTRRVMPELMRNAPIATCSLRPMEEAGREIDAHKASELIHFDAGAYGATNGDRILRFFININPTRERVWVSKGDFRHVFPRYSDRAGFTGPGGHTGRLEKGPLDHLRSGLVRGLSGIAPLAKVLDSSPYDRAMKRFHDFMKDSPGFQDDPVGHAEVHFAPYSAWTVFADGVSHGCLSGQHCFIWTAIPPLANARFPELAPMNILKARLLPHAMA
ncbi:MAG: Kdo hydroxylase family protein [Gammaproteobacteria bacterium]|nr:Kdo hydroxylase family protein [Gammaproteobacteria bacterium]